MVKNNSRKKITPCLPYINQYCYKKHVMNKNHYFLCILITFENNAMFTLNKTL